MASIGEDKSEFVPFVSEISNLRRESTNIKLTEDDIYLDKVEWNYDQFDDWRKEKDYIQALNMKGNYKEREANVKRAS